MVTCRGKYLEAQRGLFRPHLHKDLQEPNSIKSWYSTRVHIIVIWMMGHLPLGSW